MILGLILREAWYRRAQTLLAALGVAVTVALAVFWLTTGRAARRETTRLMRDMGYNLRIIPKRGDVAAYLRDGYAGATLPARAVLRFREQTDVSYNHLIAMLTGRVTWRGLDVLVTGLASEVAPRGKKKPSMSFEVARGTLHAGSVVAERLGLETGATVDLAGRDFRVAACLADSGTNDDVRVWLHLEDAQAVLGLEGRINEIRALECYCADPAIDNKAQLEAELARIVPDGRVIRIEAIAEAREKQRRMSERYLALVVPVVILACALWIGVLAALNVRQRSSEIGILRALGHGSGTVASLFLGRACLIGVGGAVAGFACGSIAAASLTSGIFTTKPGAVVTDYGLLAWSIAVAPSFAVVASLMPTAAAIAKDPATTLGRAP